MGYDTVSYDSVEPAAPGMHFLRDALDAVGLTSLAQRALARFAREDAENVGVTVLDAADEREIEIHEDSQWVLVGAP